MKFTKPTRADFYSEYYNLSRKSQPETFQTAVTELNTTMTIEQLDPESTVRRSMASSNLLRLKQYWPEDSARRTILYDCNSSPKSSPQDEARVYYRITYESTLDMIHILKYSPIVTSRLHLRSQQLEYDQEIVAEMDPSDIVGADLEVKFAHDAFLESPASLTNVKALKAARNIAKRSVQPNCTTAAAKPFTVVCGDDTTNPDTITYQELMERKKKQLIQNSAAFRQVGVYNRKNSHKDETQSKDIDPTEAQTSPSLLNSFFSRYSCSTDTTLDQPTSRRRGKDWDHDDEDDSNSDNDDTDDGDDHETDIDADDATAPTFMSALESSRSPIQSQSGTYLNIYIYPPQDAQGSIALGPREAKHVRFQIAPTIDFLDARNVVRGIRILAQIEHYCKEELEQRMSDSRKKTNGSKAPVSSKQTPVPPKYLVFINVLSGKKKAADVYEHILRPMLEQSGVEHDLFVSQFPGHAYERMSALFAILATRTKTYDAEDEASSDTEGIMSADLADISAYDGILVLGGDGTFFEILQGLRSRKKDRNELMKRLKFGIVGCGHYNGLSSSLLDASKEHNGAMEAAFMICKGQTNKVDLSLVHTRQKTYLSFSSFYWGMIADIHVESKNGLASFDGWKAMSIRTYRAKLCYLKAEHLKHIREIIQNFPPLEQEKLDDNWTTIEGNFILLWVSQISHTAYNLMQSPQSKPSDGLFRVMMIRDHCSRFTLAKILSSIRSGEHMAYKEVEWVECVAYRLVPSKDVGNFVLDGEKIEPSPIQACILPSALNVFYQPLP